MTDEQAPDTDADTGEPAASGAADQPGQSDQPVRAGRPAPGERGRWQSFGAPVLAVASVIALVLGTLVGWVAFAPHHPGTHSAEAGFARDMSEHHLQAVEMSLLVLGRSDSADVDTLAYDIASAQANQIGQMEAWLRAWGLPTARPDARMTWMEGHETHADHGDMEMGPGAPKMPGMASAEEMQQLRDAEGEEAEILFLQLMITHHISGVDMAQAAVDLADDPEVVRIAQAMVNAQQSEIDLMTDMLADRDAEPREDLTEMGPHEDHGSDEDAATATDDGAADDDAHDGGHDH